MTRRAPKTALALLIIGLAASCATPTTPAPLAGTWGGRGIGLALGPDGGALEYDCAAGRIDGPLAARGGGNFSAVGSHTPGTGGPERVDRPRPSYPATYSMDVRGDRMTLRGRVANGQALGPFELRRGAEPTLMRCL